MLPMPEMCAVPTMPLQWCQEECKGDILEIVSKVMYRVPGVQTLLWKMDKGKVNYADPVVRAVALSHVTFLPSIKGNFSSRKAQAIAVSSMSKCALVQQQAWVARVFRPAIESGGSPESLEFVPGVAKVVTLQWGETSQRVKAMLPNKLANERVSHIKVATHIMMQSGLLSTFDIGGEGCSPCRLKNGSAEAKC